MSTNKNYVWRKRASLPTNNKNNNINHINYNNNKINNNNGEIADNDINSSRSSWLDNMLSTHLPIYNLSMNYHEMPQLYECISDSIDCVLLGESTHGTQEFYKLRSMITKYLILNKGFTAILFILFI